MSDKTIKLKRRTQGEREAYLQGFKAGQNMSRPKELKALDEKEVLHFLSHNQDYEQIPLNTREKIANAICQTFGVPDVGKDDIFISHIKSHLKEGQEVVCKICGQSAKEIIAAYQKSRGEK